MQVLQFLFGSCNVAFMTMRQLVGLMALMTVLLASSISAKAEEGHPGTGLSSITINGFVITSSGGKYQIARPSYIQVFWHWWVLRFGIAH